MRVFRMAPSIIRDAGEIDILNVALRLGDSKTMGPGGEMIASEVLTSQ